MAAGDSYLEDVEDVLVQPGDGLVLAVLVGQLILQAEASGEVGVRPYDSRLRRGCDHRDQQYHWRPHLIYRLYLLILTVLIRPNASIPAVASQFSLTSASLSRDCVI